MKRIRFSDNMDTLSNEDLKLLQGEKAVCIILHVDYY